MSGVQPVTVDVTQEDVLVQLQLFPQAPLLTSHNLRWHGIHVERHRQPRWEVPQHRNEQHLICVKHIDYEYNVDFRCNGLCLRQ